jgi:phenylacetate-coenzyme A ligase PaaK-like adenylate-forming protein
MLDADEQSRVVAAALRAAGNSRWYASRLAQSGFEDAPAMEHVPVISEADLREGYYAADPRQDTDAQSTSLFATSGTTTGSGREVSWPRTDDVRYVAQRARLFSQWIDASCDSACADLGTGHAQARALEIFRVLGLDGHEIDVRLPVEKHVAILRELRADLLYTMPVILERVVGLGGPGYPPTWVVVLGDLAPRPWRRAMERQIGMAEGHIVDVFGSIEVGAIAYSDDEHDRYLMHEHIIPEQIPPAYPRDDGGQQLVITSTERDGFPAVRYATGDIVRNLRPVEVAGTRRWTFDSHLGREGTKIKHGEALSLPVITERIGTVAPGVPWAVRRDGLEVVIEIDEHAYSPAVAAAVRSAVREAHPAVDTMIRSGLIGDIGVEAGAFPDGLSKRPIR